MPRNNYREIVYAELPNAGSEIKQNEPYGTVESVKAVSDLIAPISGTIEEVNAEVQSKPELLNEDPYVKRLASNRKTSKPERRTRKHNGLRQSS